MVDDLRARLLVLERGQRHRLDRHDGAVDSLESAFAIDTKKKDNRVNLGKMIRR